jgi:hypothetical protein
MGKGKDFSKFTTKAVARGAEKKEEAKSQDRFTAALDRLGVTLPEGQKTLVALEEIRDRVKGNSREVNTRQAVERAVSIAEIGLLQNLVVDVNKVLVAGDHRRWALRLMKEVTGNVDYARKKLVEFQLPGFDGADKAANQRLKEAAELLAAGWSTHGFAAGIPVMVLSFDSAKESQRALIVEIAENKQRSDPSARDVKQARKRLLEEGFIDSGGGRPKTGAVPLWPMLERMYVSDRRTLQKLLDSPDDSEKGSRGPAVVLTKDQQDALQAFKAVFGDAYVTIKNRGDGGQVLLRWSSPQELQHLLLQLSAKG